MCIRARNWIYGGNLTPVPEEPKTGQKPGGQPGHKEHGAKMGGKTPPEPQFNTATGMLLPPGVMTIFGGVLAAEK